MNISFVNIHYMLKMLATIGAGFADPYVVDLFIKSEQTV